MTMLLQTDAMQNSNPRNADFVDLDMLILRYARVKSAVRKNTDSVLTKIRKIAF